MDDKTECDSPAYSISILPSAAVSTHRPRTKSAICTSLLAFVKNFFKSEEMSVAIKNEESEEEIELSFCQHLNEGALLIDEQPNSTMEVDSGPEVIEHQQIQRHEAKAESDEIVVDWARLDAKILKKILREVSIADVYFFRFVCSNWKSAADEYFDTTTILNWRQLVHTRAIDASVNFRARLCASCLHVALFRMPRLISIDFRISDNVREIRLSCNKDFAYCFSHYLQNIKEMHFANRRASEELYYLFRNYAPRSITFSLDG